jgi:proteic killer suppression protein
MIKSFADRRSEQLFRTGKATRFPAEVAARAARKLEYVHLATSLKDLQVPPGNRLHALKGSRRGQHAIAINDQESIPLSVEISNGHPDGLRFAYAAFLSAS